MSIFRISTAIGLGVFALGAIGAFAQTKGAAVSEITLERTPCFGRCPTYKATMKSDGTLLYEGIRFVDRIGKYKAKVYQFEKLASLANRFGLFKMKDNYSRPITDQPTAITTLKTASGKKSIRDYGNAGPEELWAFDRVFDSMIAEARDWEKVK